MSDRASERDAQPESAHRPSLMAELSAEFAGTMILILLGVAVVAQVVRSEGTLGDHDSIAWAWVLSSASTRPPGSAAPTSTRP